MCGVLVTEDGTYFRYGCAPSLPDAYNRALHEAIKTVPVTPPYFTSCAEAAHVGRAIGVSDIAWEERYAPVWRDLMQASGLLACRSTPVLASDGRVIGCLAVYLTAPRDPNPTDPDLIDIATHIAGIAIERDFAETVTASELADTQLLQRISAQMFQESDVGAIYEFILDGVLAIMRSRFGCIQVAHSAAGQPTELRILTYRGFSDQATTTWAVVQPEVQQSSCAEAWRTRKRVVVNDVMSCDFMQAARIKGAISILASTRCRRHRSSLAPATFWA